jgi:ribosomal protein L14E/L6E/L27E
MLMDNIEIGRVVISKAGRDKGRKFIILKIIDDKHVFISDGSLRKADKPKKKKLIHLKSTNFISDTLKEKIKTDKSIGDFEIRNYLKSLEEKN